VYVIGIDPADSWFATPTHHGHTFDARASKFYEPLGFAPGTRGIPAHDSPLAGNEYVCVQMKSNAGNHVTGETVICANASWTDADGITKTLLDANLNGNIGVIASEPNLTSGQFGWVLVKGFGIFEGIASTSGQAQLYTSTTSGNLGSTSSSQTAVYGISLIEDADGSGAGTCRVLYPTGLL